MANRSNYERDDDRTRDNGGYGFEEQGTRGREHDRGWGVDRPQGHGHAGPERDYGWEPGRPQGGYSSGQSYGGSSGQGQSAGGWRESGGYGPGGGYDQATYRRGGGYQGGPDGQGSYQGGGWRQGSYGPGGYQGRSSGPGQGGYGEAGYRRTGETGPYVGRGPRGYQRSNENIKEEVCERLTRHGHVDASEIEITVEDGEVTLEGYVHSRREKRLAEDAAETVAGVRDVHNRLRVHDPYSGAQGQAGASGSPQSGQQGG